MPKAKKGINKALSVSEREELIRLRELAQQQEVEINRKSLSFMKEYGDNLNTLTTMIEKAKLRELDDISFYRIGRRPRNSDEYENSANEYSSVKSRSYDNIDMSKFNVDILSGESRVEIIYVELCATAIKDFIVQNMFNNEVNQYNNYMEDICLVLNKLRSMFQYLKDMDFLYNETTFFQPIFVLFLEHCMEKLGMSKHHCLGSQMEYSVPIEVSAEDGSTLQKTLSGKTDIIVLNNDVVDPANVLFQNELKVPYGHLYHSLSEMSKNQLIGQLIGLWSRLSEDENSQTTPLICGSLTDIFSITLCFSFSTNQKQYHITNSVVDAETYLLYYLLLFVKRRICNVDILRGLCKIDVPSTKLNDTKKKRKSNGNGNSAKKSRNVATNKNTRKNNKTGGHGEQERIVFEDEKDETDSHDRLFLQWYARHTKTPYFSAENLMNSNNEASTYKPFVSSH